MRILMIANTLPPADLSGVGEQVMQLATGLRERGHEVEILGRGGAGAPGGKSTFPLRIVQPALRRIREFEPDVVQVHESDGGLLARALARGTEFRERRALLAALLQVSYVEERRAVRPIVWRGETLAIPGAVERRFRWLKAPLQIALGKRSARAADLVLAPSQATAQELVRDYGACDVRVVPNASGGWTVPEEAIAGLDGDARPWLFVGRLRIRKGVEVLLKALALAADRSSARPLWIVGEGEHRPAVEEAVARLRLGAQVRFLGRRSAAEIRWALARARALVVPSTYEGMPLVILEAMASGTPVIASAVSGIPEVVLPGATGWLVPAADPEKLRSALEEARENPAEAQRRGAEGRRRFRTEYLPANVARTWEERILERRAEKRGGRDR